MTAARHHPYHPLWLHIDHWACATAKVDIAALGALGSPWR
jgi:hypothetical protein